jgi:hypothetical protein
LFVRKKCTNFKEKEGMKKHKRTMLLTGLLPAALFLAHIQVTHTGWPLLWPVLGGATAVYSGSRIRKSDFAEGIKRGGAAGIMAALLTFIAGIPLHWLVARESFEQRAAEAGLPLEGMTLIVTMTVFLSLMCLLLYIVGSVPASWLLSRRR